MIEITITGEQSPYPRALASFQRAALQGIVSARVKVGDYYFYGQGTAVDEKLAGDNYREAAESHGNGQAFFNLGWMHHHGVGLDKDMHLAKRFYDQAIEVSPGTKRFYLLIPTPDYFANNPFKKTQHCQRHLQ